MLRVIAALIAGLLLCAQTPMLPGFPPGTFQNRAALDAGFTSTCSESSTFLARTTGLTDAEKTVYDTMICGLVTDGTWTGFDALYFFDTNSTTTAGLNLVSTSFTISPISTPTFSAHGCYTTTGSAVLDTIFTPSSSGIQYVQNSASMGLAVNTSDAGSNAKIDMGSGNTANSIVAANFNLQSFYSQNTTSFISLAATNSIGFWVSNRSASNAIQMYKNGSSTAIATNGNASTGLPTSSVYIGATNNSGINSAASRKYCAAWIARSLSGAEAASVMNRINTALTANGNNLY